MKLHVVILAVLVIMAAAFSVHGLPEPRAEPNPDPNPMPSPVADPVAGPGPYAAPEANPWKRKHHRGGRRRCCHG
ncbi:protein TsetseEP-like [Portunus trituberculatus]|uniref:protein TsetseEP-like n=1 Tax=Portunus trituberculatus TaxID=210409 RepID=UPI001E1CD968|nr:protein TsetseEP-like [Portunus trituberculatus]